MSTDTLPAIPEFLQRQKEEARAVREIRLEAEEQQRAAQEKENVRLLDEALVASVGPELAPLLHWPPVTESTTLAAFELALEGHLPIWCQFQRRTESGTESAAGTWTRLPHECRRGEALLWEVEGHGETWRTATLGEALVLADLSQHPRSTDDEIPF